MKKELDFHAAVFKVGGYEGYLKQQKNNARSVEDYRKKSGAPTCRKCGCNEWSPASRGASEDWDCGLCGHSHSER